jgi:glucose dehydrogenase
VEGRPRAPAVQLSRRVFFVTDNARLVALDRAIGKLVWEIGLLLFLGCEPEL